MDPQALLSSVLPLENQVFSGGLGLAVLGLGLGVMRRGASTARMLARRHLLMTLEVTNKDVSYPWVLQWLNAHGRRTQHLSVSTAVEPNHYGQWFCVITRRPDVQVQTIFAARKLTSTPDKGITTVLLPAGGRKACSVTHSLPVVRCLGRFEAQFAHRWAGVGNAFKDPDVLFGIGPIAL